MARVMVPQYFSPPRFAEPGLSSRWQSASLSGLIARTHPLWCVHRLKPPPEAARNYPHPCVRNPSRQGETRDSAVPLRGQMAAPHLRAASRSRRIELGWRENSWAHHPHRFSAETPCPALLLKLAISARRHTELPALGLTGTALSRPRPNGRTTSSSSAPINGDRDWMQRKLVGAPSAPFQR